MTDVSDTAELSGIGRRGPLARLFGDRSLTVKSSIPAACVMAEEVNRARDGLRGSATWSR
jgi:hypothetical protein